jgi:hypothetical protein
VELCHAFGQAGLKALDRYGLCESTLSNRNVLACGIVKYVTFYVRIKHAVGTRSIAFIIDVSQYLARNAEQPHSGVQYSRQRDEDGFYLAARCI